LDYDLITGKILKYWNKISYSVIQCCLAQRVLPAQWKVAQIFLILKPGKLPNEVTSYRPISLLPTVFTVSEKLLLKRLLPVVENNRLIMINEDPENKQYYSAAFLDIFHAFDKVWHIGLLYKLRLSLLLNYFLVLKSYLHSRHFLIKVETDYRELSSVNVGVSQDSVLGPLLYLLHPVDLPASPGSTTATFADY
jgi:hypothetical protein